MGLFFKKENVLSDISIWLQTQSIHVTSLHMTFWLKTTLQTTKVATFQSIVRLHFTDLMRYCPKITYVLAKQWSFISNKEKYTKKGTYPDP